MLNDPINDPVTCVHRWVQTIGTMVSGTHYTYKELHELRDLAIADTILVGKSPLETGKDCKMILNQIAAILGYAIESCNTRGYHGDFHNDKVCQDMAHHTGLNGA